MRNSLKKIVKSFIDPAVYDFWIQKVVPHASWETPLARVVARHVEARDAVTLVLRPNRHFLGFQAGQHVNVTVEVEGVRHTRCYSFTNAPAPDGLISLSVKEVEGGKVSRHLCRHVREGDVIELGQAFGECTIPAEYRGDWLLLAAGSGITPLMSIVRTLSAQPLTQRVDLIYWARTRADLFFYQELCELAVREPLFRLHVVLTREEDLLPGEHAGRPAERVFSRLVPDFVGRRVQTCGPADFVSSVQDLIAARVPVFLAEAFTPAQVSAIEEKVDVVQVELRASGRTLTLPTGKSLLVAIEEAGVHPAYGCRMGICNTCACGKLSGTTRNLNTGELDADQSSALRLCVNAASSDLVLNL